MHQDHVKAADVAAHHPIMATSLEAILNGVDGEIDCEKSVKSATAKKKAKKAPLYIRLNYKITAVTDVDTAIMRFRCIFKLFAWWCDPEIAKLTKLGTEKGSEEYTQWNRFFNPDLRVINAVGIAETKPAHVEKKILEHQTGRVKWSMYFCTELFCLMDLRWFPFDQQDLVIKIQTHKMSKEKVELLRVLDEKQASSVFSAENLMLPQWKYQGHFMEFRDTDASESTTGKAYHQMFIHLIVQRLWHSYVQNEAFILSLLVSFEWLAFSLEAGELWDRLEMIITLLLAMVAMKFNIRAKLPDVGYNTIADWHTLVCFITSGLLMMWFVVANRMHRHATDNDGDLELAVQIDRLVGLGMVSVWIGLHIGIGCMTRSYLQHASRTQHEHERLEQEDIQRTLLASGLHLASDGLRLAASAPQRMLSKGIATASQSGQKIARQLNATRGSLRNVLGTATTEHNTGVVPQPC
jgi:hypothetical protein